MDAVITGIGWVTAQGMGWGKQRHDFALTSAPLPPLARKDVFAEPNQRFGRQSEYSKLGLAAIAFALRDAGLEKWSEKRPVGIVASSQLGCLTTDLDYFDTVIPINGGLPSPNLFAFTLANCFLGEAAIQFGLTGSSIVVNEITGDGLYGLRTALEGLAFGGCDTMLTGICDLPPQPILPGISAPLPGAVFMVLDNSRQRTEQEYGSLELAEDGAIRHNGCVVGSFVDLVKACLVSKDGKKQ